MNSFWVPHCKFAFIFLVFREDLCCRKWSINFINIFNYSCGGFPCVYIKAEVRILCSDIDNTTICCALGSKNQTFIQLWTIVKQYWDRYLMLAFTYTIVWRKRRENYAHLNHRESFISKNQVPFSFSIWDACVERRSYCSD